MKINYVLESIFIVQQKIKKISDGKISDRQVWCQYNLPYTAPKYKSYLKGQAGIILQDLLLERG